MHPHDHEQDRTVDRAPLVHRHRQPDGSEEALACDDDRAPSQADQDRTTHSALVETRVRAALTRAPSQADDLLWQRALARAMHLRPIDATRQLSAWRYPLWIHAPWMTWVASLVFLAALACAGLGLRHAHGYVAPENRPGQRAAGVVAADHGPASGGAQGWPV